MIPNYVQDLITGLAHSQPASCCFTVALPDGTQKAVTNELAASLVLQQFYDTVQVMIGEATSVSGLKAFLKEKEHELR